MGEGRKNESMHKPLHLPMGSCAMMWRQASGGSCGKMADSFISSLSLIVNVEISALRDLMRSARVSSGPAGSVTLSCNDSRTKTALATMFKRSYRSRTFQSSRSEASTSRRKPLSFFARMASFNRFTLTSTGASTSNGLESPSMRHQRLIVRFVRRIKVR